MPNPEDWQACYRPDLCYSCLSTFPWIATNAMEGGDSMVAVVRGLGDAGLAVTLLEGCRRYTLMPNSVPHPPKPSCDHVMRDVPESMAATAEVCPEPSLCCDSSTQATDGRYASIYKMAHCNVRPTSPPVQLTEFPPQRAELSPGHGSFEVGGTGSGEKYSPVRPTTQFKGGMSWPDRGSVCAPRTLYEPDPFANSLRKYPNMSPQRSSEIVERLVNYTQARHASKSCTRSSLSPTRLSECNFNHTLDRESRVVPTRPRCCDPEIMSRSRVKTDESPTREGRPKRCDVFPEMKETAFCRNFEVRCLRDISKRTRDKLRNLAGQPYCQPCCLNGIAKYDSCPDGPQSLSRNKVTGSTTTSVNMEIQAVVEMMSREVATLPREEPSKRNVAVPISPISSVTQRSPEAPVAGFFISSTFKSVQTIPINIPTKITKSIQATSSSIELRTVVDRWQSNERRGRKSKSQEELRTRKDDFRKEMIQLLESINCHDDKVCQAFRDELIRKIKKSRRRITLGSNGRAKSAPFWIKASNQIRHCAVNCRRVNKIDVLRAEARSITVPNEDSLQNAVKDWLQEIHINNSDFHQPHSLDQIVSFLAAKLRHLCSSSEKITKSEIKKMIEEVTFDASDSDRNVQLNNLANALTNKIKDVLHSSTKKLIRCRPREGNTNAINYTYFPFKKFIQPTEQEVRSFVSEELLVFMNKFHLKFNSRNIYDIETEVADVLIDSIEELAWGDDHKVKEEVTIALQETSKMPKHNFTCLADALVKRFKSFMRAFSSHNIETDGQQTFVVLQNTVQNTSGQSNDITDTSIEPVTEADIEAHIERYTSQLIQVIEAWWTSILGADENEKDFKEVAINDLAGDIVDRHRFLDMDTSKRSTDEDEVEYLKFQIFRWINKLVGEEAMQQALDQAPKLMEQIQRIPVPIMRMPDGLVQSQNILERSGCQAPARSGSPDKVLPTKSGYNVNQLPTLGSAKRSGNKIEGSNKREATSRRMSEPAAYSLGSMSNAVKEMSDSPGPRVSSKSPQGRRYSFPENIVNPRENYYTTEQPTTNDFESYLYDWVNQIPIVVQEEGLREKLRRGIFNGVLKALAKAEIDSATSRNDFYINAFLKDEFEELLSCLPSSPELASKKTLLIEKLIERATQRTKAISVANTSTPYRHRLWDAITSTLPPRPIVADSDKSNAHLFEEFLKLNVVEDYLLYNLYNEMNLPRANAHRDKVLITLQQLYENAKMLPGSNRIISINAHNFADNIYKAMVKVNVPARNVLQDEGDQIIIAHEISQWLQELPINHSYEHLDQLQRRILRDSLAKKIHAIEKQTNFCDDSSVRQVKNELTKFIEKLSPRPEEAGNLSFLIDEFIKKLKNRREIVQEPAAFPWFFMNVPFSSSFVENSSPINLVESFDDDWKNLGQPGAAVSPMVGAEPIPKALPIKEPTNMQWLTMLNTQEQLQRERDAQALVKPSPQIPLCCQPAATPSLRSQPMSGNFGHNTLQTPYREPSNVEWLTLVNTQEQIERDNKALEARAQLQKIQPCCQPAVAAVQGVYGGMGPGILYEPVISTDTRGLHTSQVAGARYQPLSSAGKQVGVPETAPSMHSEMRHLVDLQDQRLSMMHGAIPATRPDLIDVASFVQPPAHQLPHIPSGSGVLSTSQMPRPSEVAYPKLVRPTDSCSRGTPMMQCSVPPRQIGPPEQVISAGAPINQSQLQYAAPLDQQEAVFTTRHDREAIPKQNISRPIMSPMDFSLQAPVGFSTPRQSLAGRDGTPEVADAGNVPGTPRAKRKRTREGDAVRPQIARRRLEFEEEEEEEERERDEVQCRCTERVYRRRRRRPMCCDCEEMDYPRYYPMPYPYCFF